MLTKNSCNKYFYSSTLGIGFTALIRRFSLFKFMLLGLSLLLSFNAAAAEITASQAPETILNSELQDFNLNQEKVKTIINLALNFASKHLKYQYGSANPATGGMDCSGTIYYMLNTMGITDVPRSSNLIYLWVWEKGHFYTVNSDKLDSFEFSHLNPGDLLFWSGTYAIARNPNVTHVMLYIGKNKAGQPLMVGASDGRTYKGRKIYGVSVFDFKLPAPNSKSKFLGYSCTPGINCAIERKG